MGNLNTRLRRNALAINAFGGQFTAMSANLRHGLVNSLDLWDEQARAQAKVTQAIESTGGAAGFSAEELFDMASAMQDVTRFGDENTLNNVTAQLLTFTNIAGNEFERAQMMALDLATVLDGDLQSASIMLGKALNDPIKGLSAMSRAGIQFSEDQASVIKSLAETGDIAGAQRMILQELERQYGGQAQAAAQAGKGALVQFSNAWGDLQEEVGAIVNELLPPIVGFFKTLVNGFSALPEPVKRFGVVLAGIVAP